jgi:hypothetical protein
MPKADSVHSMRPLNTSKAHSRRSFLGRAVAVLAAVGAADVTVVAAAQPAAVAERPELIDAGHRLDALQTEWKAAQGLRLEARAVAESLIPQVPEELLQDSYSWRNWTERQRDVEGVPLNDRPRIVDSHQLERALKDGSIVAPPRTEARKLVRALIKTAKKYETETEAAIEQSGLNEHLSRVTVASIGLQDLAWEISEVEPLTMLGASIQARVFCAYADAEDRHGKHHAAIVLGLPLARSIARLTLEGAS